MIYMTRADFLLPAALIAAVIALAGCTRGAQAAGKAGASTQGVTPAAARTPLTPAQAYPLLQAIRMQVPKEDTQSTDFTLESLDGRKVSLSSYKGSFVFLNFWATWCPPCRSEMPAMQALYEKLKSKGFVIVAVSVGEQAPVVREYLKKNSLTFPALLDTTGEVGGLYGAQSIPTTYLIDREGRILARGIGAQWTWDSPEMIALFEKLL
jgi:peroxiredoxin